MMNENKLRDVWELVNEWRYHGKDSEATADELFYDQISRNVERAIESSQVVPLSRYEAVLMELAVSEAKLAKVSDKARELLDMCIVAFVRIAHHPSVTWNHPAVEPVSDIANKALAKLKGES